MEILKALWKSVIKDDKSFFIGLAVGANIVAIACVLDILLSGN